MGLSSWIQALRPGSQSRAARVPDIAASAQPLGSGPTEREIFASPELLAAWVAQYVISGRPLDEDYSLLPDADARRDLEITPGQRDRCLQEYSVLRVAGVALFLKKHYSDEFFLQFLDRVQAPLVHHLGSTGLEVDRPGIRQGVETYVEAAANHDPDKCADLYLRRLYDDNPHFLRIKFAGIGYIGANQLISAFEVFREAYCKVTQGVSYATLASASAALEQVRNEAP